jgi:hypothetical protein
MESVIADRKNEVKKIIPDHYFTHFGFIPNPDGSINYLGFGQLLEPINSSVNTVLNQLIDSGTLYNTGGGFLGRGIRMRGGTYTFQPGEYKTVDCPGGALKENIVPLPTREPSVVLFQLLGFLVQAGKEISSVQDVLTGDAKLAATMPVGTMMALVEQGLKVFTAIYKRIYRSLSEEFKKLYYLNARYLDPVTSFYVSGNKNRVELSDYRADDTLVMPVADPDLSSDMQRLLKGQALKDLTGRPGLNEVAITRQLVRAIRPENMHEVLMTDAQMSGKEPIPWAPPPNPQVILAQAKANHLNARAQESALQLQMSLQKFELETEALLADIENKKADTMLKLAKAEAAEAGLQLQQYEAEMNHISEQVKARMDVVKERIKAFAQQQKQLADQEGMTEVLESDQGGMEGRAFGGPVDRGNPFVVGELGPELYVPSGSNDNQELSKLMGILNQNKNLEYVRRILAPYNSPVKVYDDDGTIASHMMMYSDHPGGRGYISFPSIVNDEEGFRELSPDEAYRHAVRSRQYIQHPTREEADWFSKNYKKVWGPIQ